MMTYTTLLLILMLVVTVGQSNLQIAYMKTEYHIQRTVKTLISKLTFCGAVSVIIGSLSMHLRTGCNSDVSMAMANGTASSPPSKRCE